ncbi:MarR family winged helix-turn-helix transcriptional regulator [Kineococcus xinjiangensis]|uniref:MarR family winged helix-turn-helix transcriptional regulator n=1 Tax=Kineococcus xinjiangensis TaxID=512762 RepID=UPI001FE7A68B|nr:MarR family transcriptional regulator [Kineococcus xinjiangensis]
MIADLPATPSAPAPGEAPVPRDPAHLAGELRVALMRSTRRLRTMKSDDELSDAQYSVLALLDRTGPRTPGELAEAEHVQPPSMTRTIGCLVERGLVERNAHPGDRRQLLVGLTPAGTAAVAETRRQRDAWLATRLATLDPAERDALARATEILRRVVAP